MIDAAVAVAGCIDGPRFAELAEIAERDQSLFVEPLGFSVKDLNLAAHEREVEVIVNGDRVAVETPPPAIAAGSSIVRDVDTTTVNGHVRIKRSVA